ncbi:MAG: hypothetical protein MPJ22_02325, partial [Pirellulales bacterium]|nr:hypothetical protein [Pirellulales bacterium]
TDTTGRDGSGAADGILSGAELATTANWSYNASRLRLAIDSAALPAGLQGGQFTGMTLPAAPTAPVVVDIISNTGLTLTEGGSTSDPTVAIRIRPPLQQAATLQILTVGKADGNSFTADASGEFADIRAVQEVRLPIGRGFESADERVIEVALSHIIDDLRVEPDETFQIKLHARPNDPFVVGATIRTITIKDDDTATFTVEQDPPGQLRRGGTVTLTGRLSAPVQVNAGDTITFEEDGLSTNGHQDIVFTDNNPNDGYIRGAEMTSDVSIDVDTLLGAAAYRHFYSDLTIGSTTLRKAAFLLPYADHPDRAQLPWHADVHYELPKIAPQHAPGSASFSGVIRVSESDLSATVPVSLNFDFIRDHTFGEARVVVTAHYDPDGDGPLPARSVSKTDVTYDDSEDSTTAQNQEFTTADFNALGIRDDEVINQTRTVTTTIALNDSTRRIVNHGITVFSGKTIRGPDITIEDDDASPAGGKQVSVHLSLADANGRPITRLQAGKRTDAFLLAEIREDGARDDARKVAVDKALSVAIGLSTAGNALSWTDLGRPDIPRAVLIRPGESSGLSARALRITPGKQGSFGFVSTSITPQNFGAFSAASAVSVAHSVIAPGGKNWLATLDNTEVTVNEGNTGLTAAVTLVDAETGLASAFSRNGAGEALTLHYAIGLLPGGAVAADLTAAAASGSASSNVPCARCSEVFGTPFSTGTVTIASGATTARIPLPGIVNDATPEDAEKFTLALTALLDSNGLPPFANGAQVARVGLAEAAADYTIAASDGGAPTTASAPQLFATPLVVLQEALDADATPAARLANVSEGSITIIRPDDAKGVIRGRVRAVDVTTNGPLDYTLGDTFELAEAQYSTSVAIAALADDLTELHEELQVEILVTAGEARPPAQKTEVVILDNDRPITLEVAETTVSVAENQLLEITVQAKRGSDTAPLRELPVEFLLTPTYPNSGAASAADFLVTVGGTTRAAQSNAEITVTGVLEPGETEATVRFPVADDEDTADESVTFTVSLPASPGAGVTSFTNSHDGGIVIGSSAATTATLTAAADASPNTLVITPTTVTRVYGEAAPTAFA